MGVLEIMNEWLLQLDINSVIIGLLAVLYLLTPLLARLVSYPGATWLKATIILAPLVVSRVWPIGWPNVVYFLGAVGPRIALVPAEDCLHRADPAVV